MDRAYASSLTTHLKVLEQKKANTPKRSKLQEIIKLRTVINQIETKRSIQKINETRRWFFEKINQRDKPLARLTRGHRGTPQINKIRNEKGDITIETSRAVVSHSFNSQHLGGRGRRISEFKASLVYTVSSRTAKAIQRNPVSEKKIETVEINKSPDTTTRANTQQNWKI